MVRSEAQIFKFRRRPKERGQQKQLDELVSCVGKTKIKIFVIQFFWFAPRNLPVMKVAAGASYIPVKAICSTEIEPVQKLRFFSSFVAANKKKFLSMLSMHYLIGVT